VFTGMWVLTNLDASAWKYLINNSDSGFEPDIIPAAMLVHRIIGIMAHWREYTRKSIQLRATIDVLINEA
jgi:hypothetical protein